MIFFDGAAFIDEAIASVFGQVGLDDWELILVDDGSTDGSTEIAQRWCTRDPKRIRYVEHPGHANLGMSAARNLGVSAACGTFVGFLDCDDVWLPSHLARRLEVAAANPTADVVIGGTWRWYSWTDDPGDRARDHRMDLPAVAPFTTIEPPLMFSAIYATPGRWNVPAMCSLLIRRTSLTAIGGSSPEFRSLHEDQVLYTKISLNLRVVIDPRPLSLYRQHADSTCAVSESSGAWHPNKPSLIEARFLGWMQRYIGEIGTTDRTVLAVVERNVTHGARCADQSHGTWSTALYAARTGLAETVRRRARRARSILGGWLCRLPDRLHDRLPTRLRHRDHRRSVVGEWSWQATSLPAATGRGTVVVVGSDASEPVWWIDRTPDDAFPNASRVILSSAVEGAVVDSRLADERFDLVVMLAGATATLDPDAALSFVHQRIRPGGTAVLLFGGQGVEQRPSPVPPVSGDQLDQVGQRWFPDAHVQVERFGNSLTAASAGALRLLADDRFGASIDHHSPRHEVFFAMTIKPAGPDIKRPAETASLLPTPGQPA